MPDALRKGYPLKIATLARITTVEGGSKFLIAQGDGRPLTIPRNLRGIVDN